MATGDITSPTIITETNGMTYLALTFTGMANSGTFAFGMGTNNDPSAAKVVLTVTSPSYDATGTAGTVTRTVYGTRVMRLAYPSDASNDVTTSGSDAVAHIALSDFIYAGETVTIAVAASLYTATTNSNSLAGGTSVTNSSTNTHAKCVGRFVTVPYQRQTGDFTVEFFGGHRSAKNGKPLACVKFIATDQHSHTSTTLVTAMSLSAANASGIRLPVYAGTIDTSGFTDGDTITVNVEAYPWVGDSGAVLKSDLVANGGDGFAQPDERLGPMAFLLDKAGTTLPPLYCVVDSATGTSSGVASTTLATAEATRCDTIATAKSKIAAIRATGEGAVIYLVDNGGIGYAFNGSSVAFTGTPRVWTTIAPHPTLGTKAGCPISSGNNTAFTGYLRFSGLSLANASLGAIVGSSTASVLWLDTCSINLTNGTAAIYKFKVGFATDNTIIALTLGFQPFSTNRGPWKLIRGNISSAVIGGASLYATVANKGVATGYVAMANAQGQAPSCNAIYAYNDLTQASVGGSFVDQFKTTGVALTMTSNSASGATSITIKCASGTTNKLLAGDQIIFTSQHNTKYTVQADVTLTTSGVSVSISPGLTEALDGSVTPLAIDAAYKDVAFACIAIRRTTTGTPTFQISADNATAALDNFVMWHMIIATSSGTPDDARGNLGYNGVNDAHATRLNWSPVGNDLQKYNNKDDATVAVGANAARTGAWPVGYMYGSYGNVLQGFSSGTYSSSTYEGDAESSFAPEFSGLYTKTGVAGSYTDLSGGDLTPSSTSPSRSMIPAGKAVLPYDLNGTAYRNDGFGTAGAYQYAEASDTTAPTATLTSGPDLTLGASDYAASVSVTDVDNDVQYDTLLNDGFSLYDSLDNLVTILGVRNFSSVINNATITFDLFLDSTQIAALSAGTYKIVLEDSVVSDNQGNFVVGTSGPGGSGTLLGTFEAREATNSPVKSQLLCHLSHLSHLPHIFG